MGGFFGGLGCNNGCNTNIDCCTLILMLLLITQCGCNDITWLLLILMLCGCGCDNNHQCR